MTVLLKKVPRSACRLQDAEGIRFELLAEDEAKPNEPQVSRQWSMLAHTGKVVSRWWGRLVLDMDGAHYRQKLALLKDHDTTQPLGFSQKIKRTDRGIEASGRLLTNELADEVIRYSREGFPFQASLMAVPQRVEELEPGAETTVNGAKVTGPLTIFREWEMHELTLTTLGADDNTTTEAFAASGEIEVETHMLRKILNAPPTSAEVLTAQVPSPHPVALAANPAPTPAPAPAAPPAPVPDGAKLERERVAEILKAADPSQLALAQQLIADGKPLAEALAAIAKDLKERLQAASQNLRVAATPISSGNSDAHEDARRAGAAVNFAAIERAPHHAESLKAKFHQDEALRAHFDSERVFLAWHKNRHRCEHLVGQVVRAARAESGELLAGGLKALGYRNVQGNYWMSFEDQLSTLWYPRICTTVETDQAMEIHKWLSSVPNPRKFTGERTGQKLTDYGITVIGEKFELTVPVDVDDLRRDKTGQIMAKVGDMGARMAELPQELVINALQANGTAFDGNPLFHTAHSVLESGSQSNDLTLTGNTLPDEPTSAQMVTNILKMLTAVRAFKNERGQPANPNARRFVLLFPTKYLPAVSAALNDIFTSAGASNTLKSMNVQIEAFDDPRLTATAATAGRRIYLFREDARIRAMIFQDESISDAFKSQGPDSEAGFWQDSVAWGSKRISAVAPGQFVLACRGTLTT
jgi:hypothetical protein